jgi:hypothetical protein
MAIDTIDSGTAKNASGGPKPWNNTIAIDQAPRAKAAANVDAYTTRDNGLATVVIPPRISIAVAANMWTGPIRMTKFESNSPITHCNAPKMRAPVIVFSPLPP